LSPPDILIELRKKYIKAGNLTLLALVPDEPSKIRHRKLTLSKNNQRKAKKLAASQNSPDYSGFLQFGTLTSTVDDATSVAESTQLVENSEIIATPQLPAILPVSEDPELANSILPYI
jgi:hypothetical protein